MNRRKIKRNPEVERRNRATYWATVTEKNCACGERAVKMARGSPACQRCIDIEAWLEELALQPKTEVGLPEHHFAWDLK